MTVPWIYWFGASFSFSSFRARCEVQILSRMSEYVERYGELRVKLIVKQTVKVRHEDRRDRSVGEGKG